MAFPIERLFAIMKDVFNLDDFDLSAEMSAADVPGWETRFIILFF